MQVQVAATPKMSYIADKELFKAVMCAISLVHKKYSTKEAIAMASKKYQQSADSITMELGKNFHLYPWLMQQREEYLKSVASNPTSGIHGEVREKLQSAVSSLKSSEQKSFEFKYPAAEDIPF